MGFFLSESGILFLLFSVVGVVAVVGLAVVAVAVTITIAVAVTVAAAGGLCAVEDETQVLETAGGVDGL